MIKLQNVSKSLLGRQVLKNVNLHVETGETFVILGPTGTGKSVTLRHIIGLLFPDEGTVMVDNIDVSSLHGRSMEEYRSKFGVVFQDGALINWLNVEENIALPLVENTKMGEDEICERVTNVLGLLDMQNTQEMMPENLSGGMKKRIGIARAIITEPQILLYDEPTAGLDPIMSRKIDALINSLKEKLKLTSLVVTHDLQSAFNIADRVAMLYEGSVIECAAPGDFLKSKVQYVRDFIEAQAHKV